MKRIVIAVAVLVVAVTGAAAYAAQSPKALRASILAAARAQHSVHWEGRNVVGSVLIGTDADVAADRGSQHVDFEIGKNSAHAQIVVVGKTAYVRGTALGVKLTLDLTTAEAKKFAGKWISIPKGDKAYGPTAEAVTLPSLIVSLTPHGSLKAVSAKENGVRVIGVAGLTGKGKKRQLKTLLTYAKGKPLPIGASVVVPAKAAISAIKLSKWNETVKVTAPSNATPIATVRAS